MNFIYTVAGHTGSI